MERTEALAAALGMVENAEGWELDIIIYVAERLLEERASRIIPATL